MHITGLCICEVHYQQEGKALTCTEFETMQQASTTANTATSNNIFVKAWSYSTHSGSHYVQWMQMLFTVSSQSWYGLALVTNYCTLVFHCRIASETNDVKLMVLLH